VKKRVLSLILALVFTISLASVYAEGGDGSVDNPYLIGTLDELIAFRNKVNNGETSACARLTANIEVGAWTPIGTSSNRYAGTFDGADYELTGITGSGNDWGFFAYTNGAIIKNLTIKAGNNGNLSLGHQSALFVAYASGNTQIKRCAGYANLSSWGWVGGISCREACTVTDCYFIGNISGTGWVTGMGFNAVATNCFVYGNIKSPDTLFKVANGSGTSHDKNFYLSVEAPTVAGYGTQKSADAFANGEVAFLLGESFGQTLGTDNHPVFRTAENTVVQDGDSYINRTEEPDAPKDEEPAVLEGDGSDENPYRIESFDTLKLFRDKVNSGENNACAILLDNVETEGVWTPIGSSTNKYSGSFDGNGYEITNLKGSGAAWAFISHTDGGAIKNLTLKTAEGGVGNLGHESALFVAKASGDTEITMCAGYGKIYSSWAHVGGITYKGNCIVTNCYFVGDIEGVHDISAMGYDSVATNCFIFGTVKATNSSFKISNKTSINSFFLNVEGTNTVGYGTQKTEDAFASGEVAYLLGEGFGQILGKEQHPVFANIYNKVEKNSKGYVNTYAIPEIVDVSFVREDDAVIKDKSGVSKYTKEIRILFNSKIIDETIEDAVTIKKINGDFVAFDGILSDDGTEYVMTLGNKLPWGEYVLSVDESITNMLDNTLSESYILNFTVSDGNVAIIKKVEVPDTVNLAGIKSGQGFSVRLSGYNPMERDLKISIIVAGYKTVNGSKKMIKYKHIPLKIDGIGGADIDETITVLPAGYENADEVKILIWNFPVQLKLAPTISF